MRIVLAYLESKNLALLQLAQGIEKRRASDELFYTKEGARHGDTHRRTRASITSSDTHGISRTLQRHIIRWFICRRAK